MDLIDRAAAIEIVSDERCGRNFFDPTEKAIYEVLSKVIRELFELPSAQPDCTDCIQNGGDFDCDHVHCHKGARVDGYTEQIRWERDIAIQQLKDLGYGLGEKVRTEMSVPQHWIPCSERPPEEQGEYYTTWTAPICKGKRFVSITEYCIPSTGEEPYWDLSEHISFYEKAEVLAWMPLPEPWKGEEK